jgi:predicted secreted protein
MKIKFRTLTRFALVGLVGFGAWRMNEIMAAGTSGPPIEQAADGSVTLPAKDANIIGPNAKFQGGKTRAIAWWTDVDTSIHWTAKINKPGKYRVELNYAVLGNRNHAELSIAAGDQATKAILAPGNGMDDFKWGQAGVITIGKSGEIPVSATSVSQSQECVVYLRSIMLRPADSPSQAVDITGSPIEPADDGTFKLPAADAEIDGMNAALETKGGEKNIGFWQGWETSVSWKIAVHKPGKYRVELNYSLAPEYEGAKVAILVSDQSVTAKPKAGADWMDFREGQAGEITISGTGYFPVVVKPVSKPSDYVFNLRSVTLVPADLPATALDISDKPIKQGSEGSIKLTAEDAEIDGTVARLEGEKYLVWRGNRDIGIVWPVSVDKPGRFDVTVTYSLAEPGSSDVTLNAGSQSISGKAPPTPGWDDFKTATLGTIDIQDKGDLQVALTSPMKPGARIMNLRAIELAPVNRQ